MVKVTLTNEGFLIENKVLFGYTEPNKKYLNLAETAGEDIISQQQEYASVEYPGEYDINGTGVECFQGKEKRLNYILNINGKKIGLIQSPEILEDQEIGDMDFRLFLDDTVAKKIDQLELEGNQIKLDRENGATQVAVKNTEDNQEVDIKVNNTKGEDIQIDVE